MRLLIRQFGRVVGVLESTPDRGVVFQYSTDYLIDPGARPLSLSLPLRAESYSQAASMPFFAGLLPDGEQRRKVADYLVSETSTLKLLDALGEECAGTVSILRDDEAE
jgi:serine/threonine-protein kinase HipA